MSDPSATDPSAHVGSVKVTMLLCDAAQVASGKLYVLGGGWSITGPDPLPSALALKLEVPWHQTEMAHEWRLRLLDADGQPVVVNTGEGEQPVEVRGDFEVGRPAGLPAGTPVDMPIAINLPPLPLAPASRYVWQLTIDGDLNEDWEVSFTTRPAPESGT